MFATNDAVEKLGGSPFDNHDRKYKGSYSDYWLNRRVARFSADPAALASKIRLTLRLSVLAGVVTSIILLLGADFVLGLFKPAYAGEAGLSLRILGLTVFPLIVKNHFVVIKRIQNQIISTALWMMAGGLLELTLAAVGASLGGLTGLSLGWVIAMSIQALFMIRTVYRVAVPASPSDPLSIPPPAMNNIPVSDPDISFTISPEG